MTEELWSAIKRLEQIARRQELVAQRFEQALANPAPPEVVRIRDKVNNFMKLQVERDRKLQKVLEQVNFALIRVLRNQSSLVDKLSDTDTPVIDYDTLKQHSHLHND